MECEQIKENVTNEPLANINRSCLKIKTEVDASCNVYFTSIIFTFQPFVNLTFTTDVCLYVCVRVCVCALSTDRTGKDPPGKQRQDHRQRGFQGTGLCRGGGVLFQVRLLRELVY